VLGRFLQPVLFLPGDVEHVLTPGFPRRQSRDASQPNKRITGHPFTELVKTCNDQTMGARRPQTYEKTLRPGSPEVKGEERNKQQNRQCAKSPAQTVANRTRACLGDIGTER
jgi:hypothetical protein